MIRPVETRDLAPIERLESRLFPRPLTRKDLESLLARPAGCGFLVEGGAGEVVSYVLFMNAGTTADVVSLGTDPQAQRAGFASRLLNAALQRLADAGVEDVLLEVAVDNEAALALYERAGFVETARRTDYYRRPHGVTDAIVMRRNLAPGSA